MRGGTAKLCDYSFIDFSSLFQFYSQCNKIPFAVHFVKIKSVDVAILIFCINNNGIKKSPFLPHGTKDNVIYPECIRFLIVTASNDNFGNTLTKYRIK